MTQEETETYIIDENNLSYAEKVDTLYATYGNGRLDIADEIYGVLPNITIMFTNNFLSGIEIYDYKETYFSDIGDKNINTITLKFDNIPGHENLTIVVPIKR